MRLKVNEEYDKIIKTKIILVHNNKFHINTNWKTILNNTDIIEYLNTCYSDSLSTIESIFRIYFNINDHPKCQYCNNYTKFDHKTNNLFKPYCENCVNKHINNMCKQTRLERYGDENYNNRNKCKQTKLERYGDKNYVNSKKAKQTKLERYGDEKYVNSKKAKQTKLERYGDENYNNSLKRNITCLIKYGDTEVLSKNSIIRNKIKESNINKYGFYNVNPTKGKQTKLERYGEENYNNSDKIQKTCLEKYGYNTILKHPEVSKKIANSLERKQNEYKTKKKNNSFNKSKSEDQTHNILKEKYPDVIRQYKSDVYPFCCDFYIPSIDLYIECNYHWTHGNKPFEGTEEDNIKLEQWKSKNTKYYDNAINIWTNLDVKKRNIAKENKLKYKEFFNIDDIILWLNLIK